MSFSKAKIQRFNEIHSCAPPPGSYNLKAQENTTGAAIGKSERFQQKPGESPASSVHSGDNGSVYSGSGSHFRTPILSKKKKVITNSTQKTPTTQLFPVGSAVESEAYREKIVECMNKDESIRDLVSQIDELKDQISHLEVQQEQLNFENQRYEQEALLTATNYDFLMSGLRKKHEQELREFTERSESAAGEAERLRLESANVKRESNERLLALKADIELLQTVLDKLAEESSSALQAEQEKLAAQEEEMRALEMRYEGALVALRELQRSHAQELEDLKKNHLIEVQDIEYEMLKCMTEAQKIAEGNANVLMEMRQEVLRKEEMIEGLKKEIEDARKDFEATLSQAEENSMEKIKLAEIQTEERCKSIEADWSMKLKEQQTESEAILKECQAIGEYNIIQSELEKNELKQELQTLENRFEEAEKTNKIALNERDNLQTKTEELSTKLEEIETDLNRRLKDLERNLDKTRNEKHTYEISLKKALETVEALKNRLINSDKDVEQLKDELESAEALKLQAEEKYNVLAEQLAEITNCRNQLLVKTENIDEYVTETVRTVEESLLKKIDDLQDISGREIAELRSTESRNKEQLQDAFEQLKGQQDLNAQAQDLIASAKFELDRLETESEGLKEENVRLRKELTESSEIDRKYIEQSGKLDALQQEFEELLLRNKELMKENEVQNALIGPYREQLEGYEAERLFLLSAKNETEEELRTVSLRNAEMLGHQNNKQKIKHLVDLKQKNFELSNAYKECESKSKAQTKLIERLRKELGEKNGQQKKAQPQKMGNILPASDKENVSPLKQRNSSILH